MKNGDVITYDPSRTSRSQKYFVLLCLESSGCTTGASQEEVIQKGKQSKIINIFVVTFKHFKETNNESLREEGQETFQSNNKAADDIKIVASSSDKKVVNITKTESTEMKTKSVDENVKELESEVETLSNDDNQAKVSAFQTSSQDPQTQ